jgi:hypothetical protein
MGAQFLKDAPGFRQDEKQWNIVSAGIGSIVAAGGVMMTMAIPWWPARVVHVAGGILGAAVAASGIKGMFVESDTSLMAKEVKKRTDMLSSWNYFTK